MRHPRYDEDACSLLRLQSKCLLKIIKDANKLTDAVRVLRVSNNAGRAHLLRHAGSSVLNLFECSFAKGMAGRVRRLAIVRDYTVYSSYSPHKGGVQVVFNIAP